MSDVLFSMHVVGEGDFVELRQRARRVAALLGFERADQTRIATAVSEVAREEVIRAAHGPLGFSFGIDPDGQALAVRITLAIDPSHGSDGWIRARRLMDAFRTVADDSVRAFVLAKRLPRGKAVPDARTLARIAAQLENETHGDTLVEVRAQNEEVLRGLDELKDRRDEVDRLNAELENTNRGVVALYAELDAKSTELQELNRTLEERIAAAIAEREQAHEQLRQSQKMEAVGQLTGGIAHDFNNLLQAIAGNLELVARNLPAENPRIERAIAQAMRAAKSAATLTQRLLAFSRRQALAPRAVDVNQLVVGTIELLRRTLGENVEVFSRLADESWVIEVDANELENALVNLGVNARDAMAEGGLLTIATENRRAAPGGTDMVAISVRDTGSGMPPEVLARVFEPFFTTKEIGKGTGLGLAMVYGFAKQSDGDVGVVSTVGEGTVVTLTFPRWTGAVAEEAPSVVTSSVHGTETVLVVEDDEAVRSYSVEALRELGYTVVEAIDGRSALDALDRLPTVDLLFTDVVLSGGMSGRQLAGAAVAGRPSLKVLYTSGYPRNVLENNGRLDAGVHMLGKPYGFDDLAMRVREVLASRRGP